MRTYAPAIVFFAAAGLAPLAVDDAYLLDTLVLILVWGCAAGAWNIAGGYAGQISLGHSAFFGLGAYAAALCGVRWNISPWYGVAIGAAVATAAGTVIGFLANRLRGPYFVIATIAVSQVLLLGAARWRGFTAGSEGIPVPFRAGFWTLGIADKRVWVWIVLVLALVVYLLQLYLERSRHGFQLAAVREDEDAALSLGVRARWLKVAAIAASAAFTAVCGALWAQYISRRPLCIFSVDTMVRFALAAIIGGLGTALGPFLGSVLVTTWSKLRADSASFGSHSSDSISFSITALILVVRYAPGASWGFLQTMTLLRVRGVIKALQRHHRQPRHRSTSPRASSWAITRPAPASRRCSSASAASTRPTGAKSIDGARLTGLRRTSSAAAA